MLLGQVEAIITDSPILVGLMYYDEKNPVIKKAFTDYIVESFKAQNNLTFYIKRLKEYNPSGRNQSEEEAKEIDDRVMSLLNNYDIPYTSIRGNRDGLIGAFGLVTKILDENRRKENE